MGAIGLKVTKKKFFFHRIMIEDWMFCDNSSKKIFYAKSPLSPSQWATFWVVHCESKAMVKLLFFMAQNQKSIYKRSF